MSDSDNLDCGQDIEADFISGAGLSAGELAMIVTNDVVLNSTQAVVYKSLANLGQLHHLIRAIRRMLETY